MALVSVRFALALAATSVGFVAIPAQAADKPSKAEQKQEALQLSRALLARYLPADGTGDSYTALLTGIVNSTAAPFRAQISSPELSAILDEYVDGTVRDLSPIYARHMPVIIEATAQAYAKAYSADELRQKLGQSVTRPPNWSEWADRKISRDKALIAANQALATEAQQIMMPRMEAMFVKAQAFIEDSPEGFTAACSGNSATTIAEMNATWFDAPERS